MLTADRDMRLFDGFSIKNRVRFFYSVFMLVLIFSSIFLFFGLFGKDFFLIPTSGTFFIFSLYGLYKVNKAKK